MALPRANAAAGARRRPLTGSLILPQSLLLQRASLLRGKHAPRPSAIWRPRGLPAGGDTYTTGCAGVRPPTPSSDGGAEGRSYRDRGAGLPTGPGPPGGGACGAFSAGGGVGGTSGPLPDKRAPDAPGGQVTLLGPAPWPQPDCLRSSW